MESSKEEKGNNQEGERITARLNFKLSILNLKLARLEFLFSTLNSTYENASEQIKQLNIEMAEVMSKQATGEISHDQVQEHNIKFDETLKSINELVEKIESYRIQIQEMLIFLSK